MKIGILTFHCAYNYGAVLQCYALQEILQEKGCQTYVIDYRPSYITNEYKIFNTHRILSINPFRCIKNFIREVLLCPKRIIRYKKFDNFINKYLYILPYEKIPDNMDVYIMGSDQIWNPKITKGFDPIYWGYLPFKKNKKYATYAASMGIIHLNEEEKKYIKKALQNFDSISTRENDLAKLIYNTTSKKVCTVLDPTLLLQYSIWDKIATEPHEKNKYILIYLVRKDNKLYEIAQNLAKKLDATVITIKSPTCEWKHKLYQCESPQEFIGWIKKAECIITNSFHGTAFSIIYNKPIYYVKYGNNDSRAISLLNQLHLNNRIIENNIEHYQLIDYKEVNNTLDRLRNKSLIYLDSLLK